MKLTYSNVYGVGFVAFLLTAATSLGTYSARFGPHYLGALLVLLATFLIPHPRAPLHTAVRVPVLFGALCYVAIWIAALITEEGQRLGLAMAMFSLAVIYMCAALMAVRLAGTQRLASTLLVTLLVVASVNLLEFVVAPNTLSTAPGRAAGFFENPNRSGAVVVALFALWRALRERKRSMRELGVFVVALAAVMVTFSRSAMISLAVVVVADIAVELWTRRRLRLPAVILLGLGALVGGYLLSWFAAQELRPEAAMRVESMRMGEFDDSSTTGRYAAFLDYLDRFLASPWTGAGAFGTLGEVAGHGPHNMFVGIAADFGIGGLACFVAMLMIGLRSARRLGWAQPMSHAQVVTATWLATSSLFSHNIIYSAEGAVMIGLMLGTASVPGAQRVVPAPKPSRALQCAS